MEFIRESFGSNDIAWTICIVASILFGLIFCFFGYRIMRVVLAVNGFISGFFIGLSVINNIAGTLPNWVIILISLLLGIIVAVVSFVLLRLGMFLLSSLTAFSISAAVLKEFLSDSQTAIVYITSAVFALLLGIMALILTKQIIIICTSLSGGSIVSSVLLNQAVYTSAPAPSYMIWGLAVFMALLGIVFQFAVTARGYEHPKSQNKKD